MNRREALKSAGLAALAVGAASIPNISAGKPNEDGWREIYVGDYVDDPNSEALLEGKMHAIRLYMQENNCTEIAGVMNHEFWVPSHQAYFSNVVCRVR